MRLADYIVKQNPSNQAYFEALVNQAGVMAATGNYQLFAVGMAYEIRTYLTQSFLQGFAACGFSPSEVSGTELQELQDIINNEMFYVVRLGNSIVALRDAGHLLSDLYPRLEVWANRYVDVYNRAQVMACGDQKLIWVLGETEHCKSCLKLEGKVKRASFWAEHNVHPQSPPNGNLECGGWNCGCALEPTTKPLSPGPLPSLP